MISQDKVLGIIYLNLTLFGVLGNSFLLYLHSFKLFTGYRKKPISLIVIHLAFVNTIMILFRGIPRILEVWNLKSSLDFIGGKIITYLIRVTRGLSLCSTCLLSVFQAITISPYTPTWAEFKSKAPKSIIPCCIFFWFFNLLVDVALPVYVTGPRNISKVRWNIGYSSFDLYAINTIKIVIWKSVCDVVFVGIMTCSSSYMVFVLYRHHQQVRHILNTSLSPRVPSETRATKVILMLVVSFVILNAVSSPLIIYMASHIVSKTWVINVTVFLSLCYPVVSPFMLLSIDIQIPSSCCAVRDKNPPSERIFI